MRKIILLAVAIIGACLLFEACTASRSFSVSIDKAENVNVSYTDSTNAVYPSF